MLNLEDLNALFKVAIEARRKQLDLQARVTESSHSVCTSFGNVISALTNQNVALRREKDELEMKIAGGPEQGTAALMAGRKDSEVLTISGEAGGIVHMADAGMDAAVQNATGGMLTVRALGSDFVDGVGGHGADGLSVQGNGTHTCNAALVLKHPINGPAGGRETHVLELLRKLDRCEADFIDRNQLALQTAENTASDCDMKSWLLEHKARLASLVREILSIIGGDVLLDVDHEETVRFFVQQFQHLRRAFGNSQRALASSQHALTQTTREAKQCAKEKVNVANQLANLRRQVTIQNEAFVQKNRTINELQTRIVELERAPVFSANRENLFTPPTAPAAHSINPSWTQ